MCPHTPANHRPCAFSLQLHSLLLSKMPHLLDRFPHVTASRQLALLTEKLHAAVAQHALVAFRPAVLAVAALSLELEQFQPEWFQLSVWLQALVQVMASCQL